MNWLMSRSTGILPRTLLPPPLMPSLNSSLELYSGARVSPRSTPLRKIGLVSILQSLDIENGLTPAMNDRTASWMRWKGDRLNNNFFDSPLNVLIALPTPD